MDPSLALELSGLFLSAGAWLCSLATTLMPTWLSLSTELLAAESYGVGLWEACVVQESGVLECRPYNSLLGLPPDIKLARVLMCLALAAGLLGLLLAIPGMRGVNGCGVHRKRALKATGGTLCMVAGVLGLVPVSNIAHLTVQRFFDESLPDLVPRWEFGDALFCGWTAAVLHLGAGSLLLTSCLWLTPNDSPTHIAMVTVTPQKPPNKARSEYV